MKEIWKVVKKLSREQNCALTLVHVMALCARQQAITRGNVAKFYVAIWHPEAKVS